MNISCATVPKEKTRALWPEIQDRFREINEQGENSLSEYWLVEGLYSGDISLHIAATKDEILAFAVTQTLWDAQGAWTDIVAGHSDKNLKSFRMLLSYIEELSQESGALGTKMALSNKRLLGVMQRFGYRERLVEVLKEVDA